MGQIKGNIYYYEQVWISCLWRRKICGVSVSWNPGFDKPETLGPGAFVLFSKPLEGRSSKVCAILWLCLGLFSYKSSPLVPDVTVNADQNNIQNGSNPPHSHNENDSSPFFLLGSHLIGLSLHLGFKPFGSDTQNKLGLSLITGEYTVSACMRTFWVETP